MNDNYLIETKNLCKHYLDGSVVALDNVSTGIKSGEVVVIIGPSGSGKSTFLRSLNLLEVPTSGSVIFEGKEITDPKTDINVHRRKMGMVFQQFNLFPHKSVIENITEAPVIVNKIAQKDAEAEAERLLADVGLSEKINEYPCNLSGGQQQRVAIARALATDPKYILCDEATSALDPNTTQSILELLKQINKTMGVTIVVITHEMKVIEQICDRVAVIDKSQIAESGKVSTVFANPKSDIAKELILPKSKTDAHITGKKSIRLVFDGEKSRRSIIADMILSTQVPVNIMYADTKDIDGTAYGHMLLELPDDEVQSGKIFAYLDTNGIAYEKEV